jgi:hypothetical protein
VSNIRIVWDNAIDRATIVASSEAGALVAANLRSNLKAKVWRAADVNAGVVCTWTNAEPISCVVAAFNNLTAQATMRAIGYTRDTDLQPAFDTGLVECAAAPGLGQFLWGSPLGENFYNRGGASLFAYGYGGYGVLWIPGAYAVRRLEVHFFDLNNPDTYIEVGRLIAGSVWSPTYNFNFGHSVTYVDSSRNKRTESGDLRGERGPKWRRIEFELSNMNSEDRASLMRFIRLNGTTEPMFVSLFPESEDTLLEQSYQLWCKFAENTQLSQANYDQYVARVAMEEV